MYLYLVLAWLLRCIWCRIECSEIGFTAETEHANNRTSHIYDTASRSQTYMYTRMLLLSFNSCTGRSILKKFTKALF